MVEKIKKRIFIDKTILLYQTYALLSITLITSTFFTWLSMIFNFQIHSNSLILIICFFIVFPYLLNKTKNIFLGIILTLLYTSFMGWYIGPIINFYIHNVYNAHQLILEALVLTSLLFILCTLIGSIYNIDIFKWNNFLCIGSLITCIALLINTFVFKLPLIQIGLDLIICFISSGYIIYQTNLIFKHENINPIIATVMLYGSIINIFLTLLEILAFFVYDKEK